MFRIERSFEIDAAHRVLNHNGKCAHLHGHRYKILFVYQAAKLNDIGVVIDFGQLKKDVGEYLDTNIDHGVILENKDSLADMVVKWDPDTKIYKLEYPATAEGIARTLYELFLDKTPHPVRLVGVRVFETPNCEGSYFE